LVTPVFLFVENLAGLDIATHAPELARRRLVKFATPGVMAFAEPSFSEHGWVVTLPATLVRVLKPLLSLLQLPVIQQDPLGWAFRLGMWKQVLSDGLLTEFIVKRLGVPVRRFYSLTSIRGGSVNVVPGCAIVGSNWLEFGSMSLTAYEAHLQYLARSYPEGLYYCHPKERSQVPEQVFGAKRVRRPDRPIEALLRSQGIPELLVGVCSSSLLSLAVVQVSQIRIELVCLELGIFDGPQADCVYRMKLPDGGHSTISVGDMQHFLLAELDMLGVAVRAMHQPVCTAAQ
jgi:hypothetical protein